ncbi:neuropeptide FF receptor 1 like 1 [Sardina pilchardus]|uniref:neuropeptide FF receptor 1 like 1 n=1 Tax=Sardina pilchardus TaxID=27697 RepID=UPI002E13FC57
MSYILSYVVVLLLCVGGNGLVCLVVLRNRNMRSVTNLFILNLAISDLLVGIFCVPTTLIDSLISGEHLDGQTTCTLSNLVQGMSVCASVFTLVAIAVDRFTGIMFPFRQRTRPVTALLVILFIWLLAFAVIVPSAAMLRVEPYGDAYVTQGERTYPLLVCYEAWPRPELRRVYTTLVFVHVYLAPLLLIGLMYGCIAAKTRHMRSRRRRKVLTMLVMVALLFMLSWLPLWTLWLLADYRELDGQQIDFLSNFLFPAAHRLAFFNSGVNPIIYGFFNDNLRRGFQAAVACGSCTALGVIARPMRLVLPRPNKVSHEDSAPAPAPAPVPVPAQWKNGRYATRAPQQTPNGSQGILLQDLNRHKHNTRVMQDLNKHNTRVMDLNKHKHNTRVMDLNKHNTRVMDLNKHKHNTRVMDLNKHKHNTRVMDLNKHKHNTRVMQDLNKHNTRVMDLNKHKHNTRVMDLNKHKHNTRVMDLNKHKHNTRVMDLNKHKHNTRVMHLNKHNTRVMHLNKHNTRVMQARHFPVAIFQTYIMSNLFDHLPNVFSVFCF